MDSPEKRISLDCKHYHFVVVWGELTPSRLGTETEILVTEESSGTGVQGMLQPLKEKKEKQKSSD